MRNLQPTKDFEREGGCELSCPTYSTSPWALRSQALHKRRVRLCLRTSGSYRGPREHERGGQLEQRRGARGSDGGVQLFAPRLPPRLAPLLRDVRAPLGGRAERGPEPMDRLC